MTYIEQIMNHPLLLSISKETIETYLKSNMLKILSYKKNTVIHLDSDDCVSVDLILDGSIHVDRIDMDGRLLSITTLATGEFFGGNTLFSSIPKYLMTISSKTEVTLLSISKACLLELMNQHSVFLTNFLRELSDRAYTLGNHIRNYNSRPLRDKLISYFEYQQTVQKKQQIMLPITKTSLAEHMGVARTSLSRELRYMENEGLISVDGKRIVITS